MEELPQARWECEGGCDFWQVLHGNPDDIKYQEKLTKCMGCQKPARLEGYKKFWDNNRPPRSKGE